MRGIATPFTLTLKCFSDHHSETSPMLKLKIWDSEWVKILFPKIYDDERSLTNIIPTTEIDEYEEEKCLPHTSNKDVFYINQNVRETIIHKSDMSTYKTRQLPNKIMELLGNLLIKHNAQEIINNPNLLENLKTIIILPASIYTKISTKYFHQTLKDLLATFLELIRVREPD